MPSGYRVLENKKRLRAIFEGIKRYFEKSPPANTFVGWRKQNMGKRMTVEVKRGDTLSDLAFGTDYHYRL